MKEVKKVELKNVELVAEISNLLGHPIRLIIVDIIEKKEGANWTEILNNLEEIIGKRLNPNTINFHLSKLVEGGIIEKKEGRFFVKENMKNNEILKAVLKEIR
jgi:DNA-binding transcriptional ArsR family regulator